MKPSYLSGPIPHPPQIRNYAGPYSPTPADPVPNPRTYPGPVEYRHLVLRQSSIPERPRADPQLLPVDITDPQHPAQSYQGAV